MEDTIQQLQQNLQALQQSSQQLQQQLTGKLDTTKVTRASDITQTGWAVDARELNASISGSLAEKIDKTSQKITGMTGNDLQGKEYTEKSIVLKLVFEGGKYYVYGFSGENTVFKVDGWTYIKRI